MNNTRSDKKLPKKLPVELTLMVMLLTLLLTPSVSRSQPLLRIPGVTINPSNYPSDESPANIPYLQGIDILFETTNDMFPRSWHSNRVDAHAESLPKGLRHKAKDILNQAIAKYPEDILFQNLEKVYILKSLQFFGVPYGATNRKGVIYLTYDEYIPEGTQTYVEGFFHHEFSSILYRKYKKLLDPCDWSCLNPSDFQYGEGGVVAILNGEASMKFNNDLFKQGFLNKYGQSAFEEDFNVFSQNLFSGGEEFWNAVDSFPRIRKKTTLLIGFYHQIDPRFTEDYFRSLSRID